MMNTSCFEFLEDIQNIIKKKVVEWWNIIGQLGDEEQTLQWKNTFKDHLVVICDEMIASSTGRRNDHLKRIEILIKRSNDLAKQLNIKVPVYRVGKLSLYEEEEQLLKRIKEYEQILETKNTEIDTLNEQYKRLCRCLGRKASPIITPPFPSQELILNFTLNLQSLKTEKFEREQEFLRIQSAVKDLVDRLKYKSTLDFEKTVISGDTSSFLVTDTNMIKLKNFYESLKKIHSNLEVEITVLREKVKRLWDQCHLAKEQREFEYLHTSLCTEDLLNLLHTEIQKLSAYYASNSDLFRLLARRNELWAKMLEIRQRATAPDRFKNRGAQLLKEEKERNTLLCYISKTEDQLLELAGQYKSKFGKPFLSWGKTVDAIIYESYQHHNESKKIKLRTPEKQEQLTIIPDRPKMELTACASTQNLMQHTPSKCKIAASLFPSTCTKVLENHNINVQQTEPQKILVNGKLTGRSRYSIERAKRIEKCRRILRQKELKDLEKENLRCSGSGSGSAFKILSHESSSLESSNKHNSATEISADSEFAVDEPMPTREISSIVFNDFNVTKTRGHYKPPNKLQLKCVILQSPINDIASATASPLEGIPSSIINLTSPSPIIDLTSPEEPDLKADHEAQSSKFPLLF